MSGEPILIAALSGRALAASARRAGFAPFVVDAFGDADTRALSGDVRILPDALRKGFRRSPLVGALDELAASAENQSGHRTTPLSLVLGPGFESSPALIGELATRFNLMGCGAESVAKANDPQSFFGLLKGLGIEHPETRLDAPDTPERWLSKREGACGGRHIRRLAATGKTATTQRHRYFQREADGETLSALAITGPRGTAIAFTRSWSAPRARAPFRFGGLVSVEELDADLEARLIDSCLSLIGPLQLVGLASFDFVVSDAGEALLLEVNPRPGASLDVLDDGEGTLFKSHIAACRGEDAIELLAKNWRPKPHAAGYLYADAGAVEIGDVDWPGWVSDVPVVGQTIASGAPIATVHAEADNPQLAKLLLTERLEKLAAVVYRAVSGPTNSRDN